MMSSAMVLSVASVFAILGCTLIGVAIGTDFWTEYHVNRREIINAFNREPELNIKLKDAFIRDPLYFSRNYGLFHICFSDAVPSDIGSYSKFGLVCITNNDYLPNDSRIDAMGPNETYRLYLMRGVVVLYVLGLFVTFASLLVGVIGCMKRSHNIIKTTAIIMFLGTLLLALGMVAWHIVDYLERHVLDVAPYYKSWESILKSTSRFNYGWSYIVSWLGIIFLLFGSVAMLYSYKALKKEEEKAYEAKHDTYMMPNFYDKGAMMPFGYNTYSGYGGYPPYAGGYQYPNAYYGYMTYGR